MYIESPCIWAIIIYLFVTTNQNKTSQKIKCPPIHLLCSVLFCSSSSTTQRQRLRMGTGRGPSVSDDGETEGSNKTKRAKTTEGGGDVVVSHSHSLYEQIREQRIKENMERMQKLGLLDLSLNLKKNNPHGHAIPKKKTTIHDDTSPPEPQRRSSRLLLLLLFSVIFGLLAFSPWLVEFLCVV